MHSTVSGRIVKPRKANSTPHQKNHRWESFTTKISKLHSLDPLRKIRRHDLDKEDLDAATSYFRNGLEKWTDLNISKPYMAFRREVLPWSDSLPQILHFQDKIFEALSRYISAYDKEALEPLLDLLTAFAHDLGARFEKYYPAALSLIVQVASRPQDAAVIEWTFACLAFLFKYLSKLIVPNIIPTYDTLAPLLGRDRNPPHIARFAAEALSFLVKKAAAPAHREKALPRLIQHARDDLDKNAESRQHGLYYHGLATMFAEAMKGQGQVVHTTGPEILRALIASVPSGQSISTRSAMWSDLVCAVLVSLVHHTRSETFTPVLEVVLDCAQGESLEGGESPRNCLYIRLLGTITGVRKGSRITKWPEVLTTLLDCLKGAAKGLPSLHDEAQALFWQQVVVNVAIVWQQAPVDAIIPCLTTFSNLMSNEPLMRWFIPFCSYFSQLDPDRFRSLFLKQFQKFVVMHWSEEPNEELLCVLLPRMIEGRGLPRLSDTEDFSLPQSWQDQIVSTFERLEVSPFPEQGAANACDKDPKTWRDKCLPKYSALLQLLEITTVRPSTYGPVAELLLRKLKLALRPSQSIATDEARFIVTQGFSAYLKMAKATGQLDSSIGPLLRAAAPRYHDLTGFLEAMIEYEERLNGKGSPESEGSSQDGEESPLLKCLIDNLSAPSHRHRLASLRLLGRLDAAADQQDALAIMLQTEETPLDVQNIRAISVHLRKLAMVYPNIEEGSWLLRAIPSFLFGVLTVRLTPLWDAAVEALAQIGSTKHGDEPVAELAFKWLEVSSKRWDGPVNDSIAQQNKGRTDFECPNLARLQSKGMEVQKVVAEPSELLLQAFEEQQELTPPNPENARSQALRVLAASPALAEKRSRRLVPFFLAWNHDNSQQDISDEEEHLDEMSTESWSLFDKKALIKVFAQFTNPKVLFQSQQVYDALLRLLGNGDLEVQKSSLKAILAWKQEGVKPYQENLEYLLDDARFKNELTVLFQGDHQIKPEHRQEMMPVLLRLLYGRTISKKGVASGRGGQHATRLAVLRQLNVQDIGGFLDIALGDLQGVHVVEDSHVREAAFTHDILPIRKQAGFLRMVEAIIDELGESVQLYTEKMLHPVLYCLVQACRNLRDNGDNEDDDAQGLENVSLHRTVRLSALKCLIALLRKAPSFEWNPFKEIIVREAISPRVEKLPVENTQGVSAVMQLIWTLSALPRTALFLAIDDQIVRQLTNCLLVEKSKDEVKVFALSVIRNLIKLSQQPAVESEFNELIEEELLQPNLDLILSNITFVLKAKGEIGKDLLTACVESVVELSPLLRQYGQAAELIDVAVFLLSEPARRVNPKVKGSILSILESMLQIEDVKANDELYSKVYSAVATLFGYFKDRTNRQALCRVLAILAKDSEIDQEVSALSSRLNAFKENRMDEPDFETRLSAFNAITKARDVQFTVREWAPLMHNMLFYIRRDEEYGVLSANAADCICRFIEITAGLETPARDEYLTMLGDVVLPAMHSNAKDESDTVRRETVKVVGVMVATLPDWAPVSDMIGLSPEPDEKESDPSFFSNILKPATARQMRALQFLIQVNHRQELSSRNLAHFFLPLLEHFIFGKEEGSDDQGVGAQAGTTIAEIAISLDWPQYRATLRRYISYIQSKPEMQKQLVRLLGKFVDTLAVAHAEKNQDAMDVDCSGDAGPAKKRKLARTMPSAEKFSEDLLVNILPPLMDYIHEKDETTVSSRVPVGIIIVKILKLLPEEALNQKLPGVLTDICHILRSKAEESRAMARDTLAKMSSLLGPSCFGFVLDELRGALTKGYQLHVLSYTMHTILVHVIPQFQPGDLDYCLDTIVAVIMDDIFGVTGQEKDAEEYTSKMKEVKSSKSQDSMELIAKTASVSHLVKLVQPLQSLLMEKLDLRMVRKIDDLLSRIATGLMGNAAAESRDTLVFCYEVIQKVYESQKPEVEPKLDPKLRRYLIQKGAKKSGERGTTNKYTFKLTRFAIDVLRAVLRKHDSLRTAANIAGFIPIFGDAIVAGEEEIKIATFKLLVVLVKVPFKTDDSEKLYKVAAKDAIRCLSSSTSTTTDIAQTSLKLMSTILRDRRDVPVKEAAIDMLLGKLKDDLTEPLYRHVTFNFLRSVLERKIETATVYDTLDYVGTIMVTNDDKDTRDLARGAFFQFLREYPQKKNRWAKQLSFVVANLQYDREGGRLSAMEIIHLLLMKSADDFVQEVATTCFIPLIMVLANDDSEKCRLAAGELIKEIFRKADKERTSKFLTLVRNWLEQDDNLPVLRLGVQGFALYFEAREPTSKDKKDLNLLLSSLIKVLDEYKTSARDTELMTTLLQTMPMLIEKHPAVVLSNGELWELITKPLAHADATVKLASVRLLSTYLADFYQNNDVSSVTETITGSHGLQLTQEKIQQLVMHAVGVLNPSVIARWRRKSLKRRGNTALSAEEAENLEQTEVDETLATETSRVVIMLAKFLPVDDAPSEESAEVEEGTDGQDDAESEDEWTGVDDDDQEPSETLPAVSLQTFLSWLSDILVQETAPRAPFLVPKVAVGDILSILLATLPTSALTNSSTLYTLLTPLHHFTDPNIPVPYSADSLFTTRYEALKTKAEESMDALQRKVGTTAYTTALMRVTEHARRRREARSRKRKIEAVSAPDRYGKWKKGKLDRKVHRRKERGQENRNRRHAY
ncbi:down-regulated in metastasis [Microdochium trichocladiopsis]|uniref:Down-regulated in metastasis n=1 Tax=Microdochium trichocladiopsis TaxID=1682393 RepID=A0A9P9BN40_9PEZI|nr:down-regulated in metastasis [Microdochium trichocladiopsis]KAH7027311.1 down-regulated in metastasis [Microdochium trichocladiopsis]